MKAVVALGSNEGNRIENLSQALRVLQALPKTSLLSVSPVYETDPMGYTDQPCFLNAVALMETALSPRALLGACLGVEAAMGRVRSFPNAPRVIDVDMLVAEGVIMNEEELIIPHPRMAERAFVLVPLETLFHDGQVLGFDFSEVMHDIPRNGVRFFSEFCL